jgi:hypothetical protein
MLRELVNRADEIPPGWKTSEEWAVIEKTSQRQVSILLRKGVLLGLLEMKKFRVMRDVLKPVPHYRLTDRKGLRSDKKRGRV